MPESLNAAQLARIEALLDRLDPQSEAECTIAGCRHVHPARDGEHHQVALAA